MAKTKPHIKLLRLYSMYYLYDVNTNSIMEISEEIYDYFKKIESGQYDDDELYNELSKINKRGVDYFKAQGLLSPKREDVVYEHVETSRVYEIYDGNLKNVTLQLTQNCNLRCKYCVYSGSYTNRTHNNKRMSEETAFKALEFLQEHSRNSKRITVGFYGGEPLLEFDLIKKCVEYSKKLFFGKELFFTITTNGTIMNEEIIDFLAENNFSTVISLDGSKEVQDANRVFADNNTGTFDTVMNTIQFIKERNETYLSKQIRFNAVVDLDKDFKCSNDFFMKYDLIKDIGASGNFINNNSRIAEINRNEEYVIDSQYEVFKIFLNKCSDVIKGYEPKLLSSAFESIVNDIHKRKVVDGSKTNFISPGGQCIPGIQRFFIDVDGNFFPCERVNEKAEELRIGDLNTGFDLDKIRHILNVGKLTEKECVDCWNFQFCGHCVSTCEDNGVLSRAKRLSRCDEMRNSTEEQLKNYLALKQYGCDFERDR